MVTTTSQADNPPHPRAAFAFIGHANAEQAILDALRSRKLAHAWLISGPEGVGKSTLAFRFARFMLANADPFTVATTVTSLGVPPEHPTARRIASGAHPDLFLLERTPGQTGKLRTEIVVEDARRATGFLQSTSGEGGWKVLVVDSADDLNRSAANSLLKIIEEPPGRSLVLLIANAPARLPPTIISRCRRLRLEELVPSAVVEILAGLPGRGGTDKDLAALADLAGGSVKRALVLAGEASAEFAIMTRKVLDSSQAGWRAGAMRLVGALGARGSDTSYDIIFDTIFDWLRERAHRELVSHASGAAGAARLWREIEARKRDADTYNLDKRALLLTSLADVAGLSP